MSISRIGQRRQVVIPKDLCEELGLQEGDLVEVKRAKGAVMIKPRKSVDPDDVLTPEEEIIVRRGQKQLKRGQSKSWREIKNALDL
jgi:AbrB family looped-hinge helix DNA binding protein